MRKLVERLRDPGQRPSLVGALAAAAAAIYTIAFIARQLPGVVDPHAVEFDARSQALVAFRFHGSGLFHDDLTVDHIAAEALPAWRAVYWIGTLFTDPFTLSKILPLLLLVFVAWQGFQFGRRRGGLVLGAATAFLLVHCNYIWDRMSGGNPRAFGFPLVIAFLRYGSEIERGAAPAFPKLPRVLQASAAELRTLATLLAMALFYPSAFLFCAPALGVLVLVSRDLHRCLRFGLVGAAAVAVGLAAMHTDPRIGRVVTPADARALPEMRTMMAQRKLPEAARVAIEQTHSMSGHAIISSRALTPRNGRLAACVLVGLLLLVARRRLRAVPPLFVAVALSSVAAFWLAERLLFRLYFPDRMLLYAWPPLVLLALPLIAERALSRLSERWGASWAAVVLVTFQLALFGDGLPWRANLLDCRAQDTKVVRFLATQPKEVMVAARLVPAAYIQTWAQRRVLISTHANKAHFYEYSLEIARRIEAFYRAYFAADWETVERFANDFHVDLLVADTADFVPAPLARPFHEMEFTPRAVALAGQHRPEEFVLGNPPDDAVLFRDGSLYVLDLRRLPSALAAQRR